MPYDLLFFFFLNAGSLCSSMSLVICVCGLFRLRRQLLSDDQPRCVCRRTEQRDARWKTSDFVVANLNSGQQVTVYLSEWRLHHCRLFGFSFFFQGVLFKCRYCVSTVRFHRWHWEWATQPRRKRAKRVEWPADHKVTLFICCGSEQHTVCYLENTTPDL